jgi:dTDP-4-amino-4,6-dideoxygalactose transaminase
VYLGVFVSSWHITRSTIETSHSTMRVPLADLHAQYLSIKPEIDVAIRGVIESSQFILGKAVEDFEKRFADAHAVKHCVGVGSGTDALHAALWALGIGRGDAVVTVPFTFIATVEAISLTGATPVFVDIEPATYTMDPRQLDELLRNLAGSRWIDGSIVKAIIPVHLYGHPAQMNELKSISRTYGLRVIEDACQAHLAQYDNTFAGNFGDVACFSFYPGKNLGAFGEAGAVTTNDDSLAQTIRQVRDHGQTEKYKHAFWGHNYRMDGIQGAVLDVKLRHLQAWTSRKRAIATLYRSQLSSLDGLTLPIESSAACHVFHQFVVRTSKRAALQSWLAEREIATARHYPIPLHLQDACHGLGYTKGNFPVSEAVASECLSLPIYPEMTDDQIEHVITSVRAFFQR